MHSAVNRHEWQCDTLRGGLFAHQAKALGSGDLVSAQENLESARLEYLRAGELLFRHSPSLAGAGKRVRLICFRIPDTEPGGRDNRRRRGQKRACGGDQRTCNERYEPWPTVTQAQDCS